MAVKTKTIKTSASPSSFSLVSRWQCEEKGVGSKKKYYFLPNMPTWENQIVLFKFNLPSGAEVISAKVYATMTSPNTGASVLNVNGNNFALEGGNLYSAKITIPKGMTELSAGINFKANGNRESTNPGQALVTFSEVRLIIEYKESGSANAEAKSSGLSIPPQSCAIYNPSNGKVYMFDGVQRIQHQNSLKIEEEPNTEKHDYINNALNEPDKLTLDVVMSDVYTGGGAIEGTPGMQSAQSTALNASKGQGVTVTDSRSAKAYGILKDLKESRAMLSVITPQYVYTEMMISSIIASQDEASPYGWSGQIVFQNKYEPVKASPENNNSDAGNGGSSTPTPSIVSGLNTNDQNQTWVQKVGATITGIFNKLVPTVRP